MRGLFATIRDRAAAVVACARSVRVDPVALEDLAKRLHAEFAPGPVCTPGLWDPGAWDPGICHVGTPASRLAYVFTLDAINFGSGWFPRLRKRAGRSGYFTVALGLKDRFDALGPWSAEALQALGPADLAHVTGQTLDDPEVEQLMTLYARALQELGGFLGARYGGRFEGLVEEAAGSAEAMVALLARMPLYRDVARHPGPGGPHDEPLEVPFYKRAQITVADLARAFAGEGPGRFEDLDDLTAFADNLVPHVLRMEGVLRYAPDLARRIDAGELLRAGSPEEVEIRAGGLHGVELLVGALRRAGTHAVAHEVDMLLWQRGQQPAMKAHPRHRARCPYY